MEELLQGFWGGVIGDMIAVIFVLCHFLGKKHHRQFRNIQIINFTLFALRYVRHIVRKLRWRDVSLHPKFFQQFLQYELTDNYSRKVE